MAFCRNRLGAPVLAKELLRQRTDAYSRWGAAGPAQEALVRPRLERRHTQQRFGVYVFSGML